jgi:hypothetical protein
MPDIELDRRGLLAAALAQAVALGLGGSTALAQTPAGQNALVLSGPAPFSFDALKIRAATSRASPTSPRRGRHLRSSAKSTMRYTVR